MTPKETANAFRELAAIIASIPEEMHGGHERKIRQIAHRFDTSRWFNVLTLIGAVRGSWASAAVLHRLITHDADFLLGHTNGGLTQHACVGDRNEVYACNVPAAWARASLLYAAGRLEEETPEAPRVH